MASEGSWAVELRSVSKRFGDCVANRDVSLKVRAGTVHALVGENGAGKSTCMKMLYGLYRPDGGQILVGGLPVEFRTPRDAIKRRIGMVHQHFMLAYPHTGLDNILLGAEPAKKGFGWLPAPFRPIDREAAHREIKALAEAYRFQVDLTKPVAGLPVGVQQRLEILKLLYRDVEVLILDEPTAVLTPAEVQELLQNLKRLKAEGKTIIIITHKLREVLAFADDVTVIRRGEVVGTLPVKDATESSLAAMMVGRAVELTAKVPKLGALGAPGLSLENVWRVEPGEKPRLKNVTFDVRAGEIVGICGVEGNGQTELLKLVTSPRRHYQSGDLRILGRDARDLSARSVRALGVGIVPEDRQAQGLLLDSDLTANFLLGLQRAAPFVKRGLIQTKELARRLAEAIRRFDVRPATPSALARGLSGGNQQKLILARELELAPALFICAQPTRGVDVGSIEFIHEQIVAARQRGAAVLLVSSALEEIQALSDRILVFYEGEVVREFARGEADEKRLGKYMGGGRD